MQRREFLQAASLAAAWSSLHIRVEPPHQASDARIDEIASLITAKMAEYHVPGVALGVFAGGQTAIRVFGVTNVDDPQPVTPETIFTIASISKTVTTTAVMKLVEDGKVDLDAPVQKYLPDFRVQDDTASRTVTPRHLLTHTPGWEGQLSTEDKGVDALADFAMRIMRELPQLAAPGQVWSYNNAGFALAGRLIEVVTGRSIHDALRDLVYTPIGLTQTFTRLPDVMTRRLSLGHREQGGRTLVLRPYQTTSSTTAGGVMTSISDLMKYARFHLSNGAAADGKAYVSRARLDEMKTPQLKKNATTDEMGVGWHLRKLSGVQTCAHGGTLNGHCLLIELVPARNVAFAILTNHTDGWQLVQDVERAILKRYESLTLDPGQPIAHRGVNEAMTGHATSLATQPNLAPYVGTYSRQPVGTVNVRDNNGSLVVSSGNSQNGATITFYGPDVAYATAGAYLGSPYEFIRTSDSKVGWIRVNGRIARRQ